MTRGFIGRSPRSTPRRCRPPSRTSPGTRRATTTRFVSSRRRLRGRWGAIAKSNFSGLRYREPVYRTLRELGMSYFEGYVNLRGDRTLRAFSRPVSLARFDRTHAGWMTSADDLWFIPTHLVGIPHTRLLTRAMERRLSRVDRRSLAAGLVGYREH